MLAQFAKCADIAKWCAHFAKWARILPILQNGHTFCKMCKLLKCAQQKYATWFIIVGWVPVLPRY